MRRFTVRAALLALLLALLLGLCPASAAPTHLPDFHGPLVEIGPAKPIEGWTRFCRQHPAECMIDRSEPERIVLTPAIWATITSVNAEVNETLQPITDAEHWGENDRWSLPEDGAGDCEDYQLLKRKLLREKGLPQRAMRMTVVLDPNGLGHAVLMIRTDRGDYILDNLTNAVLPWGDTDLVMIKRENANGAWVKLDPTTMRIAVTSRP